MLLPCWVAIFPSIEIALGTRREKRFDNPIADFNSAVWNESDGTNLHSVCQFHPELQQAILVTAITWNQLAVLHPTFAAIRLLLAPDAADIALLDRLLSKNFGFPGSGLRIHQRFIINSTHYGSGGSGHGCCIGRGALAPAPFIFFRMFKFSHKVFQACVAFEQGCDTRLESEIKAEKGGGGDLTER
jgi:hypothetical protein